MTCNVCMKWAKDKWTFACLCAARSVAVLAFILCFCVVCTLFRYLVCTERIMTNAQVLPNVIFARSVCCCSNEIAHWEPTRRRNAIIYFPQTTTKVIYVLHFLSLSLSTSHCTHAYECCRCIALHFRLRSFIILNMGSYVCTFHHLSFINFRFARHRPILFVRENFPFDTKLQHNKTTAHTAQPINVNGS